MNTKENAMEESTELKAGQTVTYTISGKTVTVKPLTLGKIKKAMMAFQTKGADTFDMMAASLMEILDNGLNPFADRVWIDNNITLLQATQIIEDMRVINGLSGFFQKGNQAAKEAAPLETRPLEEVTPTPSV